MTVKKTRNKAQRAQEKLRLGRRQAATAKKRAKKKRLGDAGAANWYWNLAHAPAGSNVYRESSLSSPLLQPAPVKIEFQTGDQQVSVDVTDLKVIKDRDGAALLVGAGYEVKFSQEDLGRMAVSSLSMQSEVVERMISAGRCCPARRLRYVGMERARLNDSAQWVVYHVCDSCGAWRSRPRPDWQSAFQAKLEYMTDDELRADYDGRAELARREREGT